MCSLGVGRNILQLHSEYQKQTNKSEHRCLCCQVFLEQMATTRVPHGADDRVQQDGAQVAKEEPVGLGKTPGAVSSLPSSPFFLLQV